MLPTLHELTLTRRRAVSSAFITTVKERCRMCYTCVRECPVKAIRITDGQAQVDRRSLHRLRQLRPDLLAARQAAAQHDRRGAGAAALGRTAWRPAWRPVFPPSSPRSPTRRWWACSGRWDFDLVVEVSFGADLVAREYREAARRDATATATSPPPARRSSATSSGIIRTWSARWRRSSRRWWPWRGRCGACTATT